MGWVTKWTIRIRQRNVDLLIHNITNRTQLVRSQYQIILTACEKYFLMSICLAHYILSQAIAWNMLDLWSACARFSCMSWFRNEWQFLHLNSVEFHFCASIFVSPAKQRWPKLFWREKCEEPTMHCLQLNFEPTIDLKPNWPIWTSHTLVNRRQKYFWFDGEFRLIYSASI